VLKRLLAVTVIAGSISGVGAAFAAGAEHTKPATPVPVTTTSTVVAEPSAQGLTETISVSVRGGSLSVRPASVVVPLTWDAAHGRYGGHADIDVIDARGTLTGWTASAVVQFADGRVSVRPAKPTVIGGYDSGLFAGKKAEVRSGEVVTLGSAAGGDGGGSFRIPVDVQLSGPRSSSAPTVTLISKVVGA
jgi:hypothetical protein